MWREPSWSWFQLTEGVGVWVKRVILKLDYDQERIKGLWHDYKTAISQATHHHSVSCPVMARDKARQTPVQVSLPRLQQATQTTIITPYFLVTQHNKFRFEKKRKEQFLVPHMQTTWSQLNTLKTIPLYEMAIEHSGSRDKHSTTYVSHFPLHFFRARQNTKKKKLLSRPSRFLRALQQNRALSSFFIC